MKGTQIFAHRGANSEAAENTRSAFEKALQYPIDGIETDVQLSLDEVAVLWHDKFLGKVGLPFKHIDDFDYADLQKMDFSTYFSSKEQPESIMALKDFLECYRKRCNLLIEIKNRKWESISRQNIKVNQTLTLIGSNEGDAIMVSSFNLDSLIYAQQCATEVPLILNLESNQTIDDARRALSENEFLYGLCLPVKILDESVVGLLRSCGKQIAVYTCNNDIEIGKALDLGVDILISDFPQRALEIRNRFTRER